jgi:N-acetylglucosamine kinase-like BadF-type ATPase
MYLGVDGGGTKTAYALVDAHGKLCATHLTGSVSHLADGFEQASATLLSGSAATLAKGGITAAELRFAFFGLPAYGEDSSTTAQMDAMPAPLLDAAKYRCGNDMVCSWAGSLACSDGISVIAAPARWRTASTRVAGPVRAAGANSSATRALPTGSRARA